LESSIIVNTYSGAFSLVQH